MIKPQEDGLLNGTMSTAGGSTTTERQVKAVYHEGLGANFVSRHLNVDQASRVEPHFVQIAGGEKGGGEESGGEEEAFVEGEVEEVEQEEGRDEKTCN